MSGEYVTDTAYVTEFRPDHAPVYLNAVAVFNGYPARPLGEGFTWCDFGCGDGLSACALAAAYPQGTFIGIDFNPDHIREANARAIKAGLGNVTFIEGDFAKLGSMDLPPLDYAILYGVLSWVPEGVRETLLDGVASLMKEGGMVLAGYDALPGWSQLLPMRERMLAETAHIEGDSLARAKAALDWLDSQREAKTKFFRDNLLAADWAEDLHRRDLHYIAHEFFNDILRPYGVREMQGMMEGRDLSFAGNTVFFFNQMDLAVPPALHGEFQAVPDRVTYEEKRDFIRNETFRRDVYVKGGPFATVEDWDEAVGNLIFGTLEKDIDRSVAFGDVQLSYDGEPFEACIEALVGGACAVKDLPCPDDLKRDAISLLAAGGQVVPFAVPSATQTLPTTFTMPHLFNRQAIETQANIGHMIALASPAAGTAVMLTNIEALLLLGLCEAGREGAVAWAKDWLEERGATLHDQGKALSREGAAAFLEKGLELFVGERLGKMVELGVIVLCRPENE